MLVGLAGCTPESALAPAPEEPTILEETATVEEPRVVLLFLPCTLNRNYLSPYNEEVNYTPRIQAFADDAITFTRHQSEAGQSGIAYSSIFTGTQADVHGVYAHPAPIAESAPTITEAFRDAGYDTFLWATQGMALKAIGTRGLDEDHIFRTALRADSQEFQKALARVRNEPDYKVLIVTAFTRTHGRYKADFLDGFARNFPKEAKDLGRIPVDERKRLYELYDQNYALLSYDFHETTKRLGLEGEELENFATLLETCYKANVNNTDTYFGKLIDTLKQRGVYDKSIIAFSADHGEILYREDATFKWTHGHALTPDVTTVAWMLRAPTSKGGLRFEGVTQSTDLFPTIAALANIPMPTLGNSAGIDLAPLITQGVTTLPDRVAFSHTSLIPIPVIDQSKDWSEFHALYPRTDPNLMWVMARDNDLIVKICNTGNEVFEPFAYDRATDPLDAHNIYDENNPDHRALFDKLVEYKQHLVADYEARQGQSTVLPLSEQEEALRSLGYIQ